jgi:hypothetical protein
MLQFFSLYFCSFISLLPRQYPIANIQSPIAFNLSPLTFRLSPYLRRWGELFTSGMLLNKVVYVVVKRLPRL